MIVYPNAKINVGLFVAGKRPDGFHDIETIFYPVGARDILEVNLAPGRGGECLFRCTGLDAGEAGDNLVARAHRLLAADFDLPPVRVHLHKQVPAGAGLGGGSSDAAFALVALNDLCGLALSRGQLLDYAARLGSDCPFFIYNRPVLARGRGEVMTPVDLSLDRYRVAIVKPAGGVSTVEAYRLVRPRATLPDLAGLASLPPGRWRGKVVNDFEEAILPLLPESRRVKERLEEAGAVYASMTGSGSAVYALFDRPVDVAALFPGYFTWQG
ncbi:MAG: 4-(cytidine 5'-diphospho)-2-C-methyl-D-erythritol kinase [Odoribacteraceae bacterium]|jgi:4-diphosphocytidyl-2-C-methyl-D-erythritol kinase|nr:4-(cytidine 5'-diphospho)-2-C-methyl-D-erythritol kinase [Odoribacteraceae bacterium]